MGEASGLPCGTLRLARQSAFGPLVLRARRWRTQSIESDCLHWGQTLSDSFAAILHFLQYFMKTHPGCLSAVCAPPNRQPFALVPRHFPYFPQQPSTSVPWGHERRPLLFPADFLP